MIEDSPEFIGVYVLWRGDEPIYIGRVSENGTIRAALLEHQDGARGTCTMRASHYSWELTVWPNSRETELLSEFHRRYGRDPECQQKVVNR